MKRTLSITISEHTKAALKPNVSASVDTIVRNFNDIETLVRWMDVKRTSCLLSDLTMSKLMILSEEIGHPVARIVTAMVELCVASGNKSHKDCKGASKWVQESQ
jgi:hypothetical protein